MFYKMGLGKIFGGIRKFVQGAGRLARKIVKPVQRIVGKISPYIRKGIEFAGKIPGIIDTVRQRKGEITDKVDRIVDMMPDGKIKDRIRGAVDRGKEIADRVIDRVQTVSDRAQPWIKVGDRIYQHFQNNNAPKNTAKVPWTVARLKGPPVNITPKAVNNDMSKVSPQVM